MAALWANVCWCAGVPESQTIGKSSPVVFGAKGDPHPNPHPLFMGEHEKNKRPSNSSIPPNEDLRALGGWYTFLENMW